jgi:drug/metabolite transporter (DMT)-like permease
MIIVAGIGDMSGFEPWQISWPESSVILRCAIVAVSASMAHWLIYLGTTRSTAADAAQAAYVQLPVALLIDALVFRHWPDAMALGGSVLIVSAGLIMWRLQRNAVIAGTQR